MSGRSYEIYRSRGVVWSLVFEEGSGRWHVEKSERDGGRARLTLEEFESGKHGRRLSGALANAVNRAQMDA